MVSAIEVAQLLGDIHSMGVRAERKSIADYLEEKSSFSESAQERWLLKDLADKIRSGQYAKDAMNKEQDTL